MFKKCRPSIFILLALIESLSAQQVANKNFTVISSIYSKNDILKIASGIIPTTEQYSWQKLEFIAFLHFGINTFTDREWGEGNEDPELFNPEKLDAEQWVKAFKAAGIKMAILTAKHHDGFCLWPSKFTEHSVKNSPWKNGKGDVVREFVDACGKYGLKVGLYLSPWDRNNSSYGDSPKYNEFYRNQLRELLTNYGEITEVWFDGANGEGPNGKKQIYDWQAYYKLIRELQPKAVIFGMSPDVRWVGTETGYGRETEWSVIPIDLSGINIDSKYPIDEIYRPRDYMGADLGSREKIYSATGMFWYPAEADVSIRPGWFYHSNQDSSVKSINELLDIYFASVGRNSVFLLNVPPNKDGLLCQNDVDTLKTFGQIIKNTFENNLAGNSKIILNAGKEEKDFSSVFGNENYWIGENDSNSTVQFNLPEEKSFDVVMLQENINEGQRIEKFSVQYWDGNNWNDLTNGTTVGYKRLLRFDPVKTNKIKIIIEQSRTEPTLSNFGLFKIQK